MEPSEAYKQRKNHEKQEAITRLDRVISSIEAAERQPDKWERVYLVLGISHVFRGAYGLAKADASRAMTPPEERSQTPDLPSDPVYNYELVRLKNALNEARSARVEPYPLLGPIQFVD
jgi:hypothetical protein